jgi:YVTN family beta-propeller protein
VTATISNSTVLRSGRSLAEDDLGNVWVACSNSGSGSVSIIDPATNTISTSLLTGLGIQPFGVGMGAGDMWVSVAQNSGSFQRYNTTTLAVTYNSPTGLGYAYNFVDDGTNVWFDIGTICYKVDPTTNARTAITAGIVAHNSNGFVHYAFGYIWRVTNTGIQRVDPTTNALTTITLSANPIDGISNDGTNLIVTERASNLYVVDPTSLTVTQTTNGPAALWGVTFDGSSIWANVYNAFGRVVKFSKLGGIFTDGASHL